MTKLTTSQENAKRVSEAVQTLYYEGFLSDKENQSIRKKVNTKYGKLLFPAKP